MKTTRTQPQLLLPGEFHPRDVLSTSEAERLGLRPLISACSQDEHWILTNVCRDMERGHLTFALVREIGGIALWRANLSEN